MRTPTLRCDGSGAVFHLTGEVTTIGRGGSVDVDLQDLTVSPLHAELVRRGAHVYVSDLGLSVNGTLVNGRPVGRRVLHDGDVVSFGAARTRIDGLPPEQVDATVALRRGSAPEVTRREGEVLWALCRPALHQEAFVAPTTARGIADELVVTEAAVKQHLLRLYDKFKIDEGVDRRARLANEVIARGVVRPRPTDVEDRLRHTG